MSEAKRRDCEGCGVTSTTLRAIESGQWLCPSCCRMFGSHDSSGDMRPAERLAHPTPIASAYVEVEGGIKHFHSKVRGVTFKNDDGSDRQRIIRACRPAESLLFDNDANNPADPNAVYVRRQNGKQVGYLSRELAEEIMDKSAIGYRFAIFATQVTGGGRGEHYGLNILIIEASPGVSDAEVQRYSDRMDWKSEIEG